MPSASYSFLDVAALDDVRERFAAGDALAILSSDLDEVIWANGPGAALFGYSDIEAIDRRLGPLGTATKRQIAATRGFPAIGHDRPLLVRMATGLSSRTVRSSPVRWRCPTARWRSCWPRRRDRRRRSARDIAERAIGGFAEAGHFVAFSTPRQIEAASAGFGRSG